MTTTIKQIIKRDGLQEPFTPSKIENAVLKAYIATGQTECLQEAKIVTMGVLARIEQEVISVEEVQDLVESELMKVQPEVAKRYILYREWRNTERQKKSELKRNLDGIVTIDSNDVNLSNANMSSHTPAGQMMTFASEVSKDYTYRYLLPTQYAEAHRRGDIHIHDLDYYPTKTTTCIQYDLADLYERGFHTKNGSIRTPQSIQSYATLATIVFQTNQNEQHGGQAIPAFDFFMAPGVYKTFLKHVADTICLFLHCIGATDIPSSREVRELAKQHLDCIVPTSTAVTNLCQALSQRVDKEIPRKEVVYLINQAIERTRRDTHQAMEGFIHNLNTMHSRGGNQVVFSSINYGTDTSAEGRMVIEELMKATTEGLGVGGEVPVFPIQIFKVKEGVNYSEADFDRAMKDFDRAVAGEMEFETPNFDLFLKACETTAKALFPNFVFLDTPFNHNDEWDAEDPLRYRHELATMGCRTRVFENINGPRTSIGRGNLSFTTINLPRLAIEAMRYAKEQMGTKEDLGKMRSIAINKLYTSIREMARLVGEQLHTRYEFQATALARQFPFMMGNDVWKGGGALRPNDPVGHVIDSGTLGIGFIGGHNAMCAIYGEGHGTNEDAWHTLYHCIEIMGEVAQEFKERYHLNYSVLATPAEGLSGRFTRLDRKRYGIIEGVNDRAYYVNSFHIDVKEEIRIADKIRLEAPFHALTLGGHITYIELDGEAKKNVKAIAKIVKLMQDNHIGYGSINHPIDTCRECHYKGVIYAKCPICGGEDILRMRRITGYLTGDLASWNSAKRAEEADRVKHH
ncbi:anaerobic ribonucleoside triphosphate reductase [Porphyromonas asaccharolytica]|uniref:anaerobic ribonucleoside triphosphate reductase n=1 Tax=Porphyromonas asaccharolytica TaxID=28123 RepID=UPI0001EB15E8|nr:anaerobic ribonucleoside triphosphate reductase [Porphyromonas asaccharolytica]EFR35399.1 anaerobic ribonucleoside-triphosphate reductase [Porphyromonas asaccharolytica PR426713P-I]